MHAIWTTFNQIVNGRFSFMLGDSVGFGKTGMAIVTMVMFHMIREAYEEVLVQWEDDPDDNTDADSDDDDDDTNDLRIHLPRHGRNRNRVCRAGGRGFQCPCNQASLSFRLMQVMVHDRPSVVFCPPDLIQNWVDELNKWVDTRVRSPAENIQVSIFHTSYSRDERYHNRTLVQSLSAPTQAHFLRDGTPSYTLDIPDGHDYGAQHIVLVSRHLASQFLSLYNTSEPWQGEERLRRGNRLTVNRMMAGFVFFDEFHNYAGSRTSKTAPFAALESMTSHCPWPTVAVGLSASLRSSPSNWRPFVQHLFHAAQVTGNAMQIAGMTAATDLDQHSSNWDYLVNRLHDPPAEGTRRRQDFNRRQENIRGFLRAFIPDIMLCRQKGNLFRGEQIFQPAPFDEVAYDMVDGPVHDVFRQLAQRVETWCNNTFQDRHTRWQRNGSPDDEEPEAIVVQRGLLDDAADNPRRNQAFEIIMHSSTFPMVAQLVFTGLIEYTEMLVTRLAPVSSRVSRLLAENAFRAEILEALRESPWWQHRNGLVQSSQKYAAVRAMVDELIRLSRLPRTHADVTGLGPPPPDGTSTRHMLVLTDSPLSAFLMLMCLFSTSGPNQNVRFIYLHSGLSAIERTGLLRGVQENCVQGDPVKVVIGTYKMASEGYNLQRANYCMLTEEPSRTDIRSQAFGRVDRTGQTMTVVLQQMYDNRNLAERVRRVRNQNRTELSMIGHQVDGRQFIDLTEFI
ncbi:hypothetical protein F5X96DRAFT_637337 [Biscogniauxia mediterranea]|nr:hypothetical protein F5X96DRAFT_637337 [Biscogniauxia mediterranea]